MEGRSKTSSIAFTSALLASKRGWQEWRRSKPFALKNEHWWDFFSYSFCLASTLKLDMPSCSLLRIAERYLFGGSWVALLAYIGAVILRTCTYFSWKLLQSSRLVRFAPFHTCSGFRFRFLVFLCFVDVCTLTCTYTLLSHPSHPTLALPCLLRLIRDTIVISMNTTHACCFFPPPSPFLLLTHTCQHAQFLFIFVLSFFRFSLFIFLYISDMYRNERRHVQNNVGGRGQKTS
mmetsp:Transcript_41167/g.106396  ORF Transcript_41167/g.106396 Transcript_41167/m.106396 type:complete len:233 (+) Transcript_41167:511-1209(+)